MAGLPGAPPLLAGTGKDEVHLLIVATADRGLAGGFNSSIVRGARGWIRERLTEGKTVKLITVGRKGRDALRRDNRDRIVENFEGVVGKRRIEFADARRIADRLLEMYEAGEFDICTIVYNRFKSAVTQILTLKQPHPGRDPAGGGRGRGRRAEGDLRVRAGRGAHPLRAPAAQPGDPDLRGLLENAASEQGARMAAMDNATRNAGDMINR